MGNGQLLFILTPAKCFVRNIRENSDCLLGHNLIHRLTKGNNQAAVQQDILSPIKDICLCNQWLNIINLNIPITHIISHGTSCICNHNLYPQVKGICARHGPGERGHRHISHNSIIKCFSAICRIIQVYLIRGNTANSIPGNIIG